ncbi:hypothetical protein [Streptomyces axinellae]|uniref:hypothetical protein n=1 Tax=Streptomyces axinellae TaxID=552788 RepID=UPI0031DDA16D
MQLDFMALALLTILLRHRDGWDVTLAEIGRKYGYGEEAMAGAMGLLQAARYVVKVRVMQRRGNRWRTEMAVYDTPATDEDVDDLLAAIAEEEPDAQRIEVIPPTKTALERAAKRRKKIAPRLRETPDSGPTWENVAKPQVAPESGVSRDSGDPGVPKKTVSKNTTEDSSRPSVPTAEVGAREADGGTDGGGGVEVQEEASAPAGARSAPVVSSPGAALLAEVGREHPHLMLVGDAFRHQALMVTGRLEEGYSREMLWTVLTQPLPVPLKKSVGAVISWRLSNLPQLPQVPAQATGPAPSPGRLPETRPTPDGLPRCDCGQLADVRDPVPRCAGCAGWPVCEGGCGRHLRDGGTCPACEWAAQIRVEPTAEGTCPGVGPHRGSCGREIQSLGMCGRCRIQAEHERLRDADPDLAAALDNAAVAASPSSAVTEAPF